MRLRRRQSRSLTGTDEGTVSPGIDVEGLSRERLSTGMCEDEPQGAAICSCNCGPPPSMAASSGVSREGPSTAVPGETYAKADRSLRVDMGELRALREPVEVPQLAVRGSFVVAAERQPLAVFRRIAVSASVPLALVLGELCRQRRRVEQPAMQAARLATRLLTQQQARRHELVDLGLQLELEQRDGLVARGVPGVVDEVADAFERRPEVR